MPHLGQSCLEQACWAPVYHVSAPVRPRHPSITVISNCCYHDCNSILLLLLLKSIHSHQHLFVTILFSIRTTSPSYTTVRNTTIIAISLLIGGFNPLKNMKVELDHHPNYFFPFPFPGSKGGMPCCNAMLSN